MLDNQEVEADPSHSLLEVLHANGKEIPHFCYHPRLSVAGNCRMCLVEVIGEPKLVASCARLVSDLRPGPDGKPTEVFTGSEKVIDAREGTMEFLLVNHPLDCPICDQGGECDLQDQALFYGRAANRFVENKRAVEEKNLGPLVKTVMTRCIHCTRCIRFMNEIAGSEALGATGRGESTEIMSYLEEGLHSELQGNIADVCPVGALTHASSALTARSWEFTKTDSIDAMDALGSHITVESRGQKVMRIVPRTCDALNESWLSDKSRYVFDALSVQRIDRPFARKRGRLVPVDWSEALQSAAKALGKAKPEAIAALVGDMAGAEEGFALKTLLGRLGASTIDGRALHAPFSRATGRGSYLFNPGVSGIDAADLILIVGANPRWDAPLVNSRILRAHRARKVPIASIGPALPPQGYPCEHLGDHVGLILELAEKKHGFAEAIDLAKKPVLILGERAFACASQVAQLAERSGFVTPEWNGFAVLHKGASRVGNLEVDLVPQVGGRDQKALLEAKDGETEVLVLLGFDEEGVETVKADCVIYVGSHGDRGAMRADLVLPGAAYTEKSVTFVNLEGRVQRTQAAVSPPGLAREDWAIIRALFDALNLRAGFNSLDQLRETMIAAHPALNIGSERLVAKGGLRALVRAGAQLGARARLRVDPTSFYQSNAIARASRWLAEAAAFRGETPKPPPTKRRGPRSGPKARANGRSGAPTDAKRSRSTQGKKKPSRARQGGARRRTGGLGEE